MIRTIFLSVLLLFSFSVMNAQKSSKKCTKKTVKTTKKKTAATKTAAATTTDSVKKEGLIYLKEGENIFLKDEQMNVTFKSVVEDSRCPEGTNCIWAGAAIVRIEFMGIYTRPQIMELSTTDLAAKNLTKNGFFNGYKITLDDFQPAKSASENEKPQYVVGLKIEKSTEKAPNPQVQRGGATTK